MNKLIPTQTTFGGLSVYGKTLRLRDRLRKREVEKDVRQIALMFHKFDLRVLYLIKSFGADCVRIGSTVFKIDEQIEGKEANMYD